ncbi:hypothetical protein AltI4_18380 [Alteromonas sp. I4]|nr:hypothetical protein AltI4_18380 [Alteromonas sp. I4]
MKDRLLEEGHEIAMSLNKNPMPFGTGFVFGGAGRSFRNFKLDGLLLLDLIAFWPKWVPE